MSIWFIYRDEEKFGPFPISEMKSFVATGRLLPTDLVWKEGLKKKVKARQVKGLFPSRLSAGLPELPKGTPDGSTAKSSGNSQGTGSTGAIEFATETIKAGGTRLRSSFGEAMGATLSSGVSACRELASRPIQYSFVTLVLAVSCFLSIFGLVTGFLIPAFVLGFISYVQSILNREPTSLVRFVTFLRHGWDSLWHLLMLFAAFVVAAGMTIAPFLIGAIILYASLGTLGYVVMQARQVVSSESSDINEEELKRNTEDATKRVRENVQRELRRREAEQRSREIAERDDQTQGVGARLLARLVMWVSQAFGNLLQLVVLLVASLIGIAVATPSGAVLILIYCISLMVVTRKIPPDGKYDLVYQAFEKMIRIAQTQWKRLLTSGLLLVSLPFGWFLITYFASSLFTNSSFQWTGMWVMTVLTPLVAFGYFIFVNIFSVMTAMDLVNAEERT